MRASSLEDEVPERCQASVFATTHWSVVLGARQEDHAEASGALTQLCTTYWRPIYAYIRRRGHSVHDAQDLTQEFFHRVVARNYLNGADPRKGRFRSFLLAVANHFLANQWRDAHTQKRGGTVTFVSFDEEDAEGRHLEAVGPGLSPDQEYLRQWALALLDRTLDRLRLRYASPEESVRFDELKIFLTGDRSRTSYAELAVRLGKSEGALKMAVKRMRERWLGIVCEEIAKTVASPAEVQDELRALLGALGGEP